MLNDLFVNAQETTQFVDIGTEEINDIIGYAQTFIGDLMPLLSLLFGVFIAITIITIIVKVIK